MGNDFGYRFHWPDSVGGFARQQEHLVIARPSLSGTLQLWEPGSPERAGWYVENEPAIQPDPPDRFSIVLPRGTREALIAELAPHADAGEVKALREALEVERRRVDDLLRQVARPTSWFTGAES